MPASKKTIQIIGIDKPFEDFMVFTSENETFFFSAEVLVEMLPKKLAVKVEKKRTRTWIMSSKEHEPAERIVDKKVDRFDLMTKVDTTQKNRCKTNGLKGQS